MSVNAEFLSGLPHLPGVYRMLNPAGEVLYVGKALDLRKRVSSYFHRPGALSPRIQHMVSQIGSVETTVTRSEAEAFLLESNLIKTLNPRYNILFRDDKSYPYLVLTRHPYPRLGFHRGGLEKANSYYGPFPSAGAVRESIQLIQKVFRIRTCEDTVFANRSRPCLLHQIRRCTAPCVGLVSEGDYAEDIRGAELFLAGKQDEIIERLVGRMNRASDRMEFEEAAMFRDQIAALRKIREKQYITDGSGRDVDIIACARAGGITCVNLVMVRGGRHLGDKNFLPQNAEDFDPSQVLEAFIGQHYSLHAVPMQLVVGAEIPDRTIQELLVERAGRKAQVVTRPSGALKTWLEMAMKNASLGAEQAMGSRATQEERLVALRRALDLPETAQRIECFDVSHTMGEATVASCVVYDRNGMQKAEYRRYNIPVRSHDGTSPCTGAAEREASAAGLNEVTPGDDYAAMRDALSRRYRKMVSGQGRFPDLVLVDGGKGQLAVAREVFSELGMNDVPVVAVAKGETRKPGLEQLLMPGRDEPLHLPKEHAALHLVQQIRDEAHRFAIAGHRARSRRSRANSPLESIAGIGAKRRQRLLARFGGLRGLLSASIDELAQVNGISKILAKKIYQELH